MLCALALSGCADIDAERNYGSRLFVGIVRVTAPASAEGMSAVDVKALGAGWDKGPWLGWRAGNWVTADPARCQLVIIIRAPAQAANAARIVRSLGGQEACVADFTRR